MNKHGHAAKGSNALVASVDFYSTALADAIAENARLQEQLAGVGTQMKGITEELSRRRRAEEIAAPVLRSAMVWAKAYGSREMPAPSPQEYERLSARLFEDVEKFMREDMDDRSSMGDE